jgi:hypothetical protein
MERIGAAVERELSRSGNRDAIPLTALTAAWPTIVGDAIARQAWPLRVARDGTLHVATVSATWANELTLLADEILARLRVQLGPEAPQKLRYAVGPVPEHEAPSQAPRDAVAPPVEVPPEIAAEASAAVAAIEDSELRELVARAARASLLRARSGRNF